jgi:prolycopene isomerase
VDRVLRALGVRERCDFAQVDPFYTAVYPGFRLQVPAGIEGFTEAHVARFPSEEKGFRQLVQLCLDIRQEAQRAPDPNFVTDFARMRKLFPTLVRYHRATLGQVARDQLGSAELASVFGTLWPYLGLPPSKVSFLYWATMLTSYAVDGAFYCRGTFQRLADAFVQAIEARDGEVLLKSSVRRIAVAEGRVQGIVLENGQRVAAPLVISNADARQTFEEMVGVEHLPAPFLPKLRRMRPSVSAFVVYCAARLDPAEHGLGHETFFYDRFDHDAHYRDLQDGRPSWLTVTVPTVLDPGLAPRGEHLYVLTTLLPSGAGAEWRREKGSMTEHLLALAEAKLPGLRAALTFVEAGSPRTMERYTRNHGGAIYGFDLAPDQVGPGRLPGRSPIEGLSLAGHWTRPGGGVYGVVTSGLDAARRILHEDRDDLLAGTA